jgi:uncharacterized protein (DUF697 family)
VSDDQNEIDRESERLAVGFHQLTKEELGLETPANIVVAGLTGVGKSTLINAIFGADFCPTGVGRPVTQGVERIVNPEIPVVLYDTKGLEIANSQQTIDALHQLLVGLRASTNPTDQPHALWLCVNTEAARFEDAHVRLVELGRTLNLPVITVLTQDYFGDSEELAQVIGEIVGPRVPVLPVVAADYLLANGRTARRRGLDRLIAHTAMVLPAAARAAFEHAQVADIEARRQRALAIVDRSALIAAVSAFPSSFVPGAHSAVLVALETHMVRAVNKALGMRLGRKETRSMTLGLAGVAAASVGGPLLATQLAAMIPGFGQLSAVSAGAVVAAGVVKGLGTAYVNAIARLISEGDFDPAVEHIIELVREAIGDDLSHIVQGRARHMRGS